MDVLVDLPGAEKITLGWLNITRLVRRGVGFLLGKLEIGQGWELQTPGRRL